MLQWPPRERVGAYGFVLPILWFDGAQSQPDARTVVACPGDLYGVDAPTKTGGSGGSDHRSVVADASDRGYIG